MPWWLVLILAPGFSSAVLLFLLAWAEVRRSFRRDDDARRERIARAAFERDLGTRR